MIPIKTPNDKQEKIASLMKELDIEGVCVFIEKAPNGVYVRMASTIHEEIKIVALLLATIENIKNFSFEKLGISLN